MTATVNGAREWLGLSVLVPMRQSLESCETSTCFGSCKSRMTEPQRIERICLLKLEARDLVSKLDGSLVEVVVALDIGVKAPVVEEGGLDDQRRKGGGLGTQELDEPAWEDVGVGFDGDDGVGEKGMEEELLVVSSQRAGRVLCPLKVFDEGGLYRLSVNGTDDEVGETAVVGLETLRAFSKSDESGECGGVVACSYVGKLLVEEFDFLSPHLVGEGVFGKGRIESGLLGICFALDLVNPLEGGLGHLLSQYSSEVGGEAITEVCKLRVARDGGDGEVWVKEVVDKGVAEARGDLERHRRRGNSR